MTGGEVRKQSQGSAAKKAVRTTVTLNPMVYGWGEELSNQNGFRSLSDYFEFLIRLHKGVPTLK